MTTDATVKVFFASPQFAVVGASSNPAKFGHKVFVWYQDHALSVTPINPITPSIKTRHGTHPTLKSLSDLPEPTNTSLSIITPPPATLEVLREARRVGIPAVWLQPGTWDDAVMAFARGADGKEGKEGKDGEGYQGAVVAGEGGGGHGGWCVLVDGEEGMKEVGQL
ncbi:Uu.00g021180.m01.CDS01 [Anthostomella pinea]|uniref:Uu.00g021180.m01.CDS01 n=1 Tax=Anthostomella pinea TaxID=933095 RepID=A0AAI8YQS2_9PEZI|nr:Uu.00g021180.m01.CDS01 [Anthostomella pinea]